MLMLGVIMIINLCWVFCCFRDYVRVSVFLMYLFLYIIKVMNVYCGCGIVFLNLFWRCFKVFVFGGVKCEILFSFLWFELIIFFNNVFDLSDILFLCYGKKLLVLYVFCFISLECVKKKECIKLVLKDEKEKGIWKWLENYWYCKNVVILN